MTASPATTAPVFTVRCDGEPSPAAIRALAALLLSHAEREIEREQAATELANGAEVNGNESGPRADAKARGPIR